MRCEYEICVGYVEDVEYVEEVDVRGEELERQR